MNLKAEFAKAYRLLGQLMGKDKFSRKSAGIDLEQSLNSLHDQWKQKLLNTSAISQALENLVQRINHLLQQSPPQRVTNTTDVSDNLAALPIVGNKVVLLNTVKNSDPHDPALAKKAKAGIKVGVKEKATSPKKAAAKKILASKKSVAPKRAMAKKSLLLKPFVARKSEDSSFSSAPRRATKKATPRNSAVKKAGIEAKVTAKRVAPKKAPSKKTVGRKSKSFSVENEASEGSILYDIPDKMVARKQHICVVRIAKNEAIVKGGGNFTSAAKIEKITISRVMNVEFVDISDPANFTIKEISSPEQLIDDESYTEWRFGVTPLNTGTFSLLLKVSVIKTLDGKERRKDLIFEKPVNISSDVILPDTSTPAFKPLEQEASVKEADPPKVFISYAHKDKIYFEIFSDNLKSQSNSTLSYLKFFENS